jgi:hypothetical protein
MRTLTIPGLLALTAMTNAGCSLDTAPASDDSASTDADELNATRLREMTAVEGPVAAETTTTTIRYEPNEPGYPVAIPYLAVEVLPRAGEPNPSKVTVEGAFPGSPRLLIVDESFALLGRATGSPRPDGTYVAALDLQAGAGRRFALVRDLRWSLPMAFTVRVGR